METQEQPPQTEAALSGTARWYIVHAYSNFEQKVAEAIRDQSQRQGLEEQFEDIQVPTEEVTEVVRGSKKVRQHRHFPGYVLVKMEMTDEAYHLVKNTPKVTGFLGTQNKPQPVSRQRSRAHPGPGRRSRRGQSRATLIHFEIGERVKVSDGPFQSFEGMVSEVDEERGRLKVAVMIFGRETPVDLEYARSKSCVRP